MIKKVWFILASSFAVGEAGFTLFDISGRKVVGGGVKASDRQYFKRSVPHRFADPAGFVRKFERKFELIFPKVVLWISTTAGPLEIGCRKSGAPIVFKVAGDLASSDAEDVFREREQGDSVLGATAEH